MFEVEKLKQEDIVSTWAGLRPLIHEDGKSPSELSRKDEIFISDSNLISIAGGKLTGFRKMAERVVDLVQKKNTDLGQRKCKTKFYKIHSNSFDNYQDYLSFIDNVKTDFSAKGITDYDAWYFVTTYGKHAQQIIETALHASMNVEKALIQSEIKYSIEHESSLRPDDFFNRRSGRINFDIESIKNNFDFIISEFNSHFAWNESELSIIKKNARTYIEDVSIIKALA